MPRWGCWRESTGGGRTRRSRCRLDARLVTRRSAAVSSCAICNHQLHSPRLSANYSGYLALISGHQLQDPRSCSQLDVELSCMSQLVAARLTRSSACLLYMKDVTRKAAAPQLRIAAFVVWANSPHTPTHNYQHHNHNHHHHSTPISHRKSSRLPPTLHVLPSLPPPASLQSVPPHSPQSMPCQSIPRLLHTDAQPRQ